MNTPNPLTLKQVDDYVNQTVKARGKQKTDTLMPVFEKLKKKEREYFASLIFAEAQPGAGEGIVKSATENLPKIMVHKDRWTVYVKPLVVVEIAYNDVQKSPRYESGYALRFARVKRIRSDKSPQEINTIIDLLKLEKERTNEFF